MTIHEAWLRLKAFIQRQRLDRDLEDELQFHLAMREQKRRTEGMSAQDARHQSRKDLGNPALLKETTRELWAFSWLETLWQDARYGVRTLRRSPGVTAVAIISLALGIGATTAIFSVADAALVRSLPVDNPERLRVILWTGRPRVPLHNSSGYSNQDGSGRRVHSSFSYPFYKLMGENAALFSDLIGFAHSEVTVVTREDSHYANAAFVTGNFFSALGMTPLLGRMLSPDDDGGGAPLVAVISYQYWQRHLGLEPEIVGHNITINSHPVTVVGVAPRTFQGVQPGFSDDLFVAISHAAVLGRKDYVPEADNWWVQMMARLRPDISDRQVQAALTVAMEQADAAYPATPRTSDPWRPIVEPGGKGILELHNNAQGPVIILSCVVGLVLLIACANIANLLLARGTARRREIAVRLAIGAGRPRIMRQLLTESFLLACAGAGIGLLFASPFARVISNLATGSQSMASIDARTLVFSAGATILTALLFGLLPAIRTTRVDLTPTLKDGSSGGLGASPQLRLSRFLVVGQVTLSTFLLIGAGLFVRTLVNLVSIDPGFNSKQLLVFSVDGSRSGYQGENLAQFYENIRERVAAIPGVQAATVSSIRLISSNMSNSDLTIPGYVAEAGHPAEAYHMAVGNRFLQTVGIPILVGRDISDHDVLKTPKIAVVNETFARQYLAGTNPLGRMVYFGHVQDESKLRDPIEVVGVCKDAKYDTLKNDAPPTIYMSYLQDSLGAVTFDIRTTLPPMAIAGAVRRTVADIDRRVPVAEMTTQEEQIQSSLRPERMYAGLIGGFGLTAALLAAVGLYGLMAYSVARRTKEIGIRLALGAASGVVRWMVLRDSLVLVLIGLALGIPAALAFSGLIRVVLFGVAPGDYVSYTGAGLLMFTVAAVAAWIPARRAARVDPMVALRCE